MTRKEFFKNIFSSSSKTEKWGNSYFYPLNSTTNIFSGNNYLKDFQEIPELNAIINIRARAISSWKLLMLSKETGKEQAANQSLIRILKTPNWFQSQREFWRQSSLFRDIYGNEYLYFLRPVGMTNTNKGLFTLDPAKVKIVYKTKTPYFLEAIDEAVVYKYDMGNSNYLPLDKSALIHLNDNRVKGQSGMQATGDEDSFLKGTSKIASLQAALKNIRAAYTKRHISLESPIGVFSNGQSDAIGQAVPMDPDEKSEAQSKFKTRGPTPIFTSLAVKFDAIQVNARNMGLFEETREDTGRICDAFGVPYELLASQKGVTFTNLKEAKKQMYEETIIPDAQEKIDALNQSIGAEGKSWEISGTFNHLPIFAEDLNTRAMTLNTMIDALDKLLLNNMITTEQYKKELEKFGL